MATKTYTPSKEDIANATTDLNTVQTGDIIRIVKVETADYENRYYMNSDYMTEDREATVVRVGSRVEVEVISAQGHSNRLHIRSWVPVQDLAELAKDPEVQAAMRAYAAAGFAIKNQRQWCETFEKHLAMVVPKEFWPLHQLSFQVEFPMSEKERTVAEVTGAVAVSRRVEYVIDCPAEKRTNYTSHAKEVAAAMGGTLISCDLYSPGWVPEALKKK